MTVYSNKLSVNVNANSQTVATVHINVADASSGKPISKANVVIHPGDYKSITNDQGFVEFNNIPYGTYIVYVGAYGYNSASQIINVQGSMSTTIYLTEEIGQYNVIVKIKTYTLLGWQITSDNGQVTPASATITPTQSQTFTAVSVFNANPFIGWQISGNLGSSQIITGSKTITLTSSMLSKYATSGSTVTLYAVYSPVPIFAL